MGRGIHEDMGRGCEKRIDKAWHAWGSVGEEGEGVGKG